MHSGRCVVFVSMLFILGFWEFISYRFCRSFVISSALFCDMIESRCDIARIAPASFGRRRCGMFDGPFAIGLLSVMSNSTFVCAHLFLMILRAFRYEENALIARKP